MLNRRNCGRESEGVARIEREIEAWGLVGWERKQRVLCGRIENFAIVGLSKVLMGLCV